jgi:hypothetical protein
MAEFCSEPGGCKPVDSATSNPPESASDQLAGCSPLSRAAVLNPRILPKCSDAPCGYQASLNRVSGIVP